MGGVSCGCSRQGRKVAARGREFIGRQKLIRRSIARLFVEVGEAFRGAAAAASSLTEPAGQVEMVKMARRGTEAEERQMLEGADQVFACSHS